MRASIDRWIAFSITLSISGPQSANRLAARPGTRTNRFRWRSAAGRFALVSAESAGAVAPLANLVRSGKLPADQQPAALALLMRFGGPPDLSLVFDDAWPLLPIPRDARVACRPGQGGRERKVRPAGDLGRLTPLLSATDEGVLAAAHERPAPGKSNHSAPAVGVGRRPRNARLGARCRPGRIGGAWRTGQPRCLGLSRQTDHPTAAGVSAIAALVSLDMDRAAAMATVLLVQPPDGLDLRPLLSALLARKQGAAALTAALKDKTIPADTAKLAFADRTRPDRCRLGGRTANGWWI